MNMYEKPSTHWTDHDSDIIYDALEEEQMDYPFYCKECGCKIEYLFMYNGRPQCKECGKGYPEQKKTVRSTSVITNKGGKRVCRS